MKYHFNLGSFFEEVCFKNADSIALHYLGFGVTYRELNLMSNCIAALLVERGVHQGDVVAIVNTKEPESYAAMIACLKIGAAYTNIDSDNPTVRSETILRQCNPKLILADSNQSPDFLNMTEKTGVPLESLKQILTENVNELEPEVVPMVTGSRIAYIMFTSGSTGIPKGVAITHQNVLSFINWSTDRYNITPCDIFANVSPMYFDNSVFDFYTALFSGASLFPIKKELLSKPKELLQAIDATGCTIWFSVPSMLIYLMTMRALSKNSFGSIRVISFGGEGFNKSELKKLYDLYGDRIDFINVYGPTEGTCICSSYKISEQDFDDMSGLPPLGSINPNFDYIVLNEEGKVSDRGELCILGPNIGLGYYNDQKRSDEVFSYCFDYGFYATPMYKTGDLVSQRDGLLYFLGRKDNQIKHMGYRIELEEIELALNQVAGVHQVVVIYDRVNNAYGKIVAFIACDADLSASVVREKLIETIPEYMHPNAIRFLRELPKNQNGKVDRKELHRMFKAR
jgi:D-alanine--poly(phosphoribitol) ligase subunit 1